jgi:hypothetical protein
MYIVYREIDIYENEKAATKFSIHNIFVPDKNDNDDRRQTRVENKNAKVE